MLRCMCYFTEMTEGGSVESERMAAVKDITEQAEVGELVCEFAL